MFFLRYYVANKIYYVSNPINDVYDKRYFNL